MPVKPQWLRRPCRHARSAGCATVRTPVQPGGRPVRAQLALLFNASFTRSGVNGTVRSRTPAAS
jgi:hypothetical protein